MANRGYFIITDISGYTEYLTGSELDHANEILQSLFEAQIAAVKHPFIISGFRGDAIFMYAPETNFIQPQTLLEGMENFYVVFADTLQQMQYNTACTCRACRNMSMLDLKLCIHYGEYLVQKLAGREELLGADVIVPHRMLKNNVVEQTNVKAYALFSDAAAQSLILSALCDDLKSHTETYEHLGEVHMLVHDLRPVWERERAKRRFFVDADQAWVGSETEVPFPPALIWEYLTKPELEAGVLGLDYAERTDSLGGRVREGADFHCAHGDMHLYNKVMDWKPFEYYTIEQRSASLVYYQTRRIIPTGSGAVFAIYLSKPLEGATDELQAMMQTILSQSISNLGPYMQNDVASSKVTVTLKNDK